MAFGRLEAIQNNPNYHELVIQRQSLGITLSALVFILYFGFILLVAVAPGFLGASLTRGVTTVSIAIGLLVIVGAFVLAGIYTAFADLRCRFAILP